MTFGRLPDGLRFRDPAACLSTLGGCGLLPWAPGTWGSLATLPFAWLIAAAFGNVWLIAAALAVFALGLWSSARYLRRSAEKDPGAIVVDEAAGQLLALAAAPTSLWWYAAGFVLFRAADILKPWPASWADRKLKGAAGVMADDMFAGLWAMCALFAARFAEAR